MSEIDRLDDLAKTVQRPIKTDFDDLDASVALCVLMGEQGISGGSGRAGEATQFPLPFPTSRF